MKQKLSLVLVLILIGLPFSSCIDDETSSDVLFTATLNGANGPDPTPSTATGTATLTFNEDTKIFSIVVNYTGMTATNAHIHKGASDASGPPVFPFSSFTTPIHYTSEALTTEQKADLYAGLYYVNLHSTTYPAGEIRGQLIKQ